MKQSEMLLINMPEIVATCIVLHNLCILTMKVSRRTRSSKQKHNSCKSYRGRITRMKRIAERKSETC